ncbi:hypothetical protein FHU41_000090 [Psychromicrobium silvestre]|uniref:Uncharacterized protein n=1 Tax=Psychromicrobium silvestre TaxID=1645614 RepID=A0A7Y9LQS6_9MICC|nr:hypothetical protein [Psychromicrobium silvestre]NYE93869.1 hypothetical protein [Psychromicrobium silvestre]
MQSGRDTTAVQATRVSKGVLGVYLAVAVFLFLIGPGILLLPDDPGDSEAGTIGAIIGGVIGCFFGVIILITAAVGRDEDKQLTKYGVPASAEIEHIKLASSGEESNNLMILKLQISGSGFETFEATAEKDRDDSWRIGDHLVAIVVPATRLFDLP